MKRSIDLLRIRIPIGQNFIGQNFRRQANFSLILSELFLADILTVLRLISQICYVSFHLSRLDY